MDDTSRTLILLATNMILGLLSGMVLVWVELRYKRRFVWNVFNISCVLCSIAGILGGVVEMVARTRFFSLPWMITGRACLTVMEITYSVYIYKRSHALLASNRWILHIRVWFWVMMFCILITNIVATVYQAKGNVSMNFYFSAAAGILVMVVDIFYTMVFANHVFRLRHDSKTNPEILIVSKCGIFCSLSTIVLMVFFALAGFSKNRATALNMLVISRFCTTLTFCGMVGMKWMLYKYRKQSGNLGSIVVDDDDDDEKEGNGRIVSIREYSADQITSKTSTLQD